MPLPLWFPLQAGVRYKVPIQQKSFETTDEDKQVSLLSLLSFATSFAYGCGLAVSWKRTSASNVEIRDLGSHTYLYLFASYLLQNGPLTVQICAAA